MYAENYLRGSSANSIGGAGHRAGKHSTRRNFLKSQQTKYRKAKKIPYELGSQLALKQSRHLLQQDQDQQHVKLETVGYAAPPGAPCDNPCDTTGGLHYLHYPPITIGVTVPQKY
ncbi:hypothetical protein E2C01_063359 [Portunus trituberculatus]|uniref:Uncharacterized protein n=1 Tax=Portunus trituberculatus TaxID=210409 RepID=A0A5B7HKM2_PORTR|nr:hypothetical protein [Portunus trituberculatus]